MEHGKFCFERLDVFRAAHEALQIAVAGRERLRGFPGDARPQLERSTLSLRR